MKLSAAGLKNIDYKQLAVDHGEKVVVAVIGLFVAWALYGTSWKPYDKTPTELAQSAEETREKIETAQWPEAAKFQPKFNLKEQVNHLLTGVSAGRYNFTTPFIWSLYRKKEPVSEPVWLPVDDLLADQGQVLLPLKPLPGTEPVAAAAKEKAADKKEAESDSSAEFKPRKGARTGARPAAGGPRSNRIQFGGLAGNREAEDAELARKFQEEQAKMQRNQRKRGRKRGDDAGPGYVSNERGKGFRFVAVRGVYPLHQQLQELRKSMHIDTISTYDLLQRIQFQGFQLERQTAVRGAADPWSGPWEPVDIAVAKMVLDEAAEWEDDTLALGVTSNIFTMSLPYRAVGEWGPLASHPGIKEFELSDEEIDAQIKISQALLAKVKADKAKEPPKIPLEGFASNQEDLRTTLITSRNNASGQEAELESLVKELGKEATDDAEKKKLEEMIRNREKNPEGKLLLFRYLDFDVREGNTYRYRVRLSLYNPNVNLRPEDVISPEVIEGPLRKTEWSKPTGPVTVEEDTDYFVKKVESERQGAIPSAKVDLFQWSPETGTIVNDELKTLVGQYVAGTVKTHVLRPVPETFEKEAFPFSTEDILVDVNQHVPVDRTLHADLKLPANAKEIPGIADQALVMNRFGELVSVDPSTPNKVHEDAETRVKEQNKYWEEIKDADAKAAAAGGSGISKRGDDEDGGKGSFGKTGKSKAGPKDNPRRKSSKKD